jgi:hypothetical protein
MSQPISPNPDLYPCCGALTFGDHRDNIDAGKCSTRTFRAALASDPHEAAGWNERRVNTTANEAAK